MDARSEVLGLIRSRKDGFSLPQPFYNDPNFFRLDLELIWSRDWLFAGHDCKHPGPGTFFTLQVGDYPVVVVRDLEGSIRAFHNTCRHHGSRVCATDKGAAVRVVCPYHQWSYSEAAGLPSRFRMDRAGQFRMTRAPLLGDSVSYTMSGGSAVHRHLSGDVTADKIGTLMLFRSPTTWNHVLSDHAVTFRVLPISATEMALTTKWLVHKDAVEGVDCDLKELGHA